MDEQKEYGKKLVNLQNQKEREIKQLYYDAILEVTTLAATLPYKDAIFSLNLYPFLKLRVDLVLKDMATKLEVVVVNGIDQAWELSDQKNRVFLDRRLRKYHIASKVRKTLFDTNIGAKKAFIQRKANGLNLSKRIVNTVKTFKRELEVGIAAGIAEGQSANKMATIIKQNLNEPDKVFRKVRAIKGDKNSRLKLSKAALEYKPGQGVYRSSFKNALRITRTETNMAYRTADYERWQGQLFVVGIQIQLSDSHPHADICDPLTGKYPKDFKWIGWHPHCICYQTPILITTEEMDNYQDQILGLGKWDGKSVNQVNDPPSEFYKYLEDNKDSINGLSSIPYWIQDNEKYTGSLAA
jgi:hypothetical protein